MLTRFLRHTSVFVATLLALSSGGCTTSRAVLAWRAGVVAERAGDTEEAGRKYAEAHGRDGNQYGAELAAIRLLLVVPDQREAGEKRLATLLGKRGARPDVAAFGALWAVARGDVAQATARLAAGRAAAELQEKKAKGACAPAAAAWLRAGATVAATAGRWQDAAAGFARAGALCGADAADARWLAVIAWNLQCEGDAPAQADSGLASSAEGRLLLALQARGRGSWGDVATLLRPATEDGEDAEHLALRAEAAVHLGQVEDAQALAERAARAAPQSAFAQQVWALALLSAGQWQRARDLLAGLVARGGDHDDWTIAHDLGIAEIRLGHLVAAVGHFERAARQCPTCEPAVRNLELLQRIGRVSAP